MMPIWTIPSLKVSVPLALILFSLVHVLILHTYSIPRALDLVEARGREDLFQRISHLQGTVEYLQRNNDLVGVMREIAALASQPEYEIVALADDQDRILAATRQAWFGRTIRAVIPEFDPAQATRALEERRALVEPSADGSALVGYTGIEMGPTSETLRPDSSGRLFFRYNLERDKLRARSELLRQSYLWMVLIASLAVLLWLTFHLLLTRRADRLIASAERLALGDLSTRSELRGADEMARLSEALDAMAGRMDRTRAQADRDEQERRRAERAVRESEERLQQILNNTTALIYVRDPQGRFILINRHLGRLLHTTQREIAGKTVEDIYPAATAAQLRANDARVFASNTGLEFEETITLDDGPHTYISLKFPLQDTDHRNYAICGISTDITHRKRTEQILRQAALGVSEAKVDDVFRVLVEHLTQALQVDIALIGVLEGTDSIHTRALFSHGEPAENITYPLHGSPCENVVGQQFRFYPDTIQERFPKDALLREIGMESYAAIPLFDSDGGVLGLLAVLHGRPIQDRELTRSILRIFAGRAASELERERAHEALRTSEASYRGLFNSSQDSVFVHAIEDGAIVDVNSKACSTYGYSARQFLSMHFEDLSAGEDARFREAAGTLFARAVQGETLRTEWQRVDTEGHQHWDEVFVQRVRLAGVDRIVTLAREITARKMAQQALRASEEQYRTIFNASTDGIALWNRAGGLIDLNPAFSSMHGYTQEAFRELSPTDFVHPDSLPAFERFLHAAHEGLEFYTEARDLRQDGSVIDIEVHSNPVNYQGERLQLTIVRDITEKKRAERDRIRLGQQLRQAQKMEAIGHLTGGIAHDFNNILTGMMGYATLAIERTESLSDEKLTRYLSQIERSGARARDLIQQMLTFSRGQRGEPRPLALGPLIGEACKLMQSVIPSSVEFLTDIDTETTVVADPVQVEQVLMNLCINARDAMNSRGTLRISLAPGTPVSGLCTACRQPFDGRFAELSVGDTGTGMPPELVDRIFEPFFTTKEVGKGTGMGLSTVHGIVHEHGGHICVETGPDSGTRFRIFFPAQTEQAPDAGESPTKQAGQTAEPDPCTAHVLVIDDEASVAEFMRDLLESRGLRTSVETDSFSALRCVTAHPQRFDVVVTDHTMPGKTGIEVATVIHRINPALPVILYSGHSEPMSTERLRELGIQGYLNKPVDIDALIAMILDLVSDHPRRVPQRT